VIEERSKVKTDKKRERTNKKETQEKGTNKERISNQPTNVNDKKKRCDFSFSKCQFNLFSFSINTLKSSTSTRFSLFCLKIFNVIIAQRKWPLVTFVNGFKVLTLNGVFRHFRKDY